MPKQKKDFTFVVSKEYIGLRLDRFLAMHCPEFSRSFLSKCVKEKQVFVDENIVIKNSYLLAYDQSVRMEVDLSAMSQSFEAEEIDLKIISDEKDFLIIEKPVQFVVHPAVGNESGTLVNALLYHYPELMYLPRAGLIHRLDKNTTGLLLVAKNPLAYQYFVRLMSQRLIKRRYKALLQGEIFPDAGMIDLPLARDEKNRLKRSVNLLKGKKAITHYQVIEYYSGYSYVEAQLETGRTHQLRVHFSHLGFPILGDRTYGFKENFQQAFSEDMRLHLQSLEYQLLQAYALSFQSLDGKQYAFQIPLSQEIQTMLDILEEE